MPKTVLNALLLLNIAGLAAVPVAQAMVAQSAAHINGLALTGAAFLVGLILALAARLCVLIDANMTGAHRRSSMVAANHPAGRAINEASSSRAAGSTRQHTPFTASHLGWAAGLGAALCLAYGGASFAGSFPDLPALVATAV